MKLSVLWAALWTTSALSTLQAAPKLSVRITSAEGILNNTIDGHVQLMFSPAGVSPLDDTDVSSSPNYFFGRNALFGISAGSVVALAGGDGESTDFGVWGWPNISIDEVVPGEYSVQAFLNPYDTAERADGSVVTVRFPCGDGGLGVGGYGTPFTSIVNVTITGESQTIDLDFDNITAAEDFAGKEIGGCQQGNYDDTELLKFVKIRSSLLSEWWGRDVFVGASVLLPSGYTAADKQARYPVVYYQDHWEGPSVFRYPDDEAFASAWENGTIPATDTTEARPAPKMIIISFRHENSFYDDSYAANTANLGPWGDAINDELIPHLDAMFNTVAAPYGRLQTGGSTGGWESIANLIYRPDLFGVCFSSYPDSLDFHRHQDIHLYDEASAYVHADGSAVPSIRAFRNGTLTVLTTVAQENHWELTYGTTSRSFQQWDIWNAVFGVQGYNSYPLEPWDKVTGEIYPEAVELWKPFDLSNWVTSNWDNELNLGKVLKGRIFLYVGLADNYYLNEGVAEFQKAVEAKGGPGWANLTYLANQTHGGEYQRRTVWNELELFAQWFEDHAPDGVTPLGENLTTPAARGNKWADVQAHGGRQAAIARQADPEATGNNTFTVGRWDPGVKLSAQWIIHGIPNGRPFPAKQGQTVSWHGPIDKLQLAVTGTKRGYMKETRYSA